MPEKLQKVTLTGAPTHFAPSKESIAAEVQIDHAADEQVDRLKLIVSDRNGNPVYREIWTRRGVEETLEPAKKCASVGPPVSFTWTNGENNQLAQAKDDADAIIPAFVTPLGSPFRVSAIAELSKVPEPESPGGLSRHPPESAPCRVESETPTPKWLLKSLVFKASGVSSKSFTLRDYLVGDFKMPASKADRFCYATGKETGLEICWDYTDNEQKKSGTLDLFMSGKTAPIWTKKLDDKALALKSLKITTASKEETELNDLLTVHNSPYKLRLTLQGDLLEHEYDVAWTYIDVMVEKMDLCWGEAKHLPPRPSKDGAAEIVKEEALLLCGLKKIAVLEHPDSLTELLAVGKDSAGALALAGTDHELVLRSNIFYQHTDEWKDGTASRKYAELWGNGPRIPIYAKILVRDAAGKAVVAPLALKGAQVLWDWDDPRLDKEQGIDTQTFMHWALHKKVLPDATADSPKSTNCPVAYGGKRGVGGAAVFPVSKGAAGAVKDKEFPFKVEEVAARKWAAKSDVYTGETVAYQGMTGVLFQPSRIAGDTYRIRAYLLLDGMEDEFKGDQEGAFLWAQANQAGLPTASAGNFEVWRRIDILSYFKKNGTLPSLDFDVVNRKFAPAKLRLVSGPFDAQAVKTLWGKHFKTLLDELDVADKNRNPKMRSELEPVQPADSPAALTTRPFAAFVKAGVDAGLDELKAKPPVGAAPNLAARVDTIKKAPVPWVLASRHLTEAELAKLAEHVGMWIFNDANNRQHTNAKICVNFNDTNTASEVIGIYLQASTLMGSYLKEKLLAPLAGKYVEDKGLVAKQGMHIFHFADPASATVDTKGSALALTPGIYKAPSTHAGKQGLFYFCAPDPETVVQIFSFNRRDPFIMDPIATRIPGSGASLFLSSTFIDDALRQDDLQAALTTIVNACAVKVLETFDPKGIAYPEATEDKEKETWHQDFDLWTDYTNIQVRGGSDPAVDAMLAKLKTYKTVTVATKAHKAGNEQDVYLSLLPDLNTDLAGKLHFKSRSADLKANDIRQTMLDWVKKCFKTSMLPIGTIYVFHQATKKGGARKDTVVEQLNSILAMLDLKLKLNSYADLRPIINPTQSEKAIYLSTQADFQEARKDKDTALLTFNRYSDDISKNDNKKTMRDFLTSVCAKGVQVPSIYVFYKNESHGRKRRLLVCNYLDHLLEKKLQDDRAVDVGLPLNPLVAHELGHCLFLEHSPPTEDNTWRHVPGYSCLMNYDASRTEFCAICLLNLRGWDIGTKDKGNFLDGPAYTSTSTSTGTGPTVARTDTTDFVEEYDDGWEFVGYHGTSSKHRGALRAGLKKVEAKWDADSGGELGPGFYVTMDYPTACLYGAGVAQLEGTPVDIWRVECRVALDTLKSMKVPVDKQYGKITEDLCQAPYDYLSNALEDPPVQIKFNANAFGNLRIALYREGMSVDSAHDESAKKSTEPEKTKKLVRAPKRVVKTKGDGDCFFYSLAYFVKSDLLEQTDFDTNDKTYGDAIAQQLKAAAVRKELADDLVMAVYNQTLALLDPDPALTAIGLKYEDTWNKLSNGGADTVHWGDSLLKTVKDLEKPFANAGGGLVWGDIQFLWRLILARYTAYTRIIVYHGGSQPQVFGAEDGAAIKLYHSRSHYEVFISMDTGRV